jgi:hypothetical protein
LRWLVQNEWDMSTTCESRPDVRFTPEFDRNQISGLPRPLPASRCDSAIVDNLKYLDFDMDLGRKREVFTVLISEAITKQKDRINGQIEGAFAIVPFASNVKRFWYKLTSLKKAGKPNGKIM